MAAPTANEGAMQYNDPIGQYGKPDQSTIGKEQFNMFKWQRKALEEVAKDAVFGQLSSTIQMPKHMGKTLKRYHYIPFLSDLNINDEGINTLGKVLPVERTGIIVTLPGSGVSPNGTTYTATSQTAFNDIVPNLYTSFYGVVEKAAAGISEADVVKAAIEEYNKKTGGKIATTLKTPATLNAVLFPLGYAMQTPGAEVPATGNLYGSSKDVAAVSGKMPRLDENGGQKNRVGGRRVELTGNMDFFGMYRTWTRESLDFDTDDQLQAHQTREMMFAAHEVTEDAIQIDLLNGAGVIRFGGTATNTSELSGNTGSISLVTYKDLMKLSIILDDNRCDKDTKLISGSRMTDTRTIRATRVLYIGSELQPMIEEMKDLFTNAAFVSVEKYAAAGQPIAGEIGKIGGFTVVVAREMMHWEGAGATVANNAGYRETNSKYDVFPMLVVGNDSFNTIGFATDGKSSKFKIINKMPGEGVADLNDPYGLTGFSSISWYYGMIITRPERIALVKTVAEWG